MSGRVPLTYDEVDLGVVYRDARDRLGTLVLEISSDASSIPVPACPAWSVHDVLAHLVAVVEDVLAGRLTRPPTDSETAAQVARRHDRATASLIDEWADLAPPFEELLHSVRVWPAALDVLTHEQDIRAAIDQPGARDEQAIHMGAAFLVAKLQTPVDLLVRLEGEECAVGPGDGTGERLELTTTSFEALRFRLGRRSRAQLANLAWSGDPSPVIDHLMIFGPSPLDIIE